MLDFQYQQRGVTLIESLVAVVVMTIGMLGIAALQLTAMSQNTSALNHSQAAWIASNMSDRIRANLPVYDMYAGINTSNGYSQDCETTACSAAQMMTADAADWKGLVEALPGGLGLVTDNLDVGADSNALIVTVMWDDDGTGATGQNCGPDTEVDLTCYSVSVPPPVPVLP